MKAHASTLRLTCLAQALAPAYTKRLAINQFREIGYATFKAYDSYSSWQYDAGSRWNYGFYAVDGDPSNYWNAKIDLSVYGLLETLGETTSLYCDRFRYTFEPSATSVKKRVKYIDLYNWNGTAYVKFCTLYVGTGVIAGTVPAAFVNLATGVAEWVLPQEMRLYDGDPRMGIVTREYWGDDYAYKFVYTLVPHIYRK